MTKKVFWEDPYLTELEATVTKVDGQEILIDRTIFFAFSGGQESDHGTISGLAVREARKSGQDIVYMLNEKHGLKPGDRVMVEIDRDRRYQLMRLHLAAEIVLELTLRRLNGIKKIGAHISAEKARIDFHWQDNIATELGGIERQATELIQADKEIVSAYSDEQKRQRFWEIKGFAKVPCGGTHLHRTREIGGIELKRKNPGQGKERIEIRLKSERQ